MDTEAKDESGIVPFPTRLTWKRFFVLIEFLAIVIGAGLLGHGVGEMYSHELSVGAAFLAGGIMIRLLRREFFPTKKEE